jgi:hypothetical protein
MPRRADGGCYSGVTALLFGRPEQDRRGFHARRALGDVTALLTRCSPSPPLKLTVYDSARQCTTRRRLVQCVHDRMAHRNGFGVYVLRKTQDDASKCFWFRILKLLRVRNPRKPRIVSSSNECSITRMVHQIAFQMKNQDMRLRTTLKRSTVIRISSLHTRMVRC